MSIAQLKNVSISFGELPLLNEINLVIQPKERIGLVGRNGTGKSTLLKILQGELKPEEGEVLFQDGLVVEKLIQEIPQNVTGDVRSVMALADKNCGHILCQYYNAIENDDQHNDKLQTQLNESDAWAVDQHILTLASKFGIDPYADFNSFSGGMKRRVFLARSLLNNPDLLLLDEPTNHLDIQTIEWMEKMLLGFHITLFIVSHDRSFINRLATRIIDLDRGQITSWPGNFDQYLAGKEKWLEDETQQQKIFDKRLQKEEIWIRQGIKARRTRNEGRVRSLKKMRGERAGRRTSQKSATFKLNEGAQSGQLVAEAVDVSYRYPDSKTVINNFNCMIIRGDKIGIIGPNGCGKSTLIQLLTGKLEAHSGSINLGTRLDVAYLDQHRSDIREDCSLLDNIAQGRSEVVVNGKSMHVMTYIQTFLFSPQRAQMPVRALSGGERNRLILAKLFTSPFNLLILDEPTNDLDIDTLELLEEMLIEYQGTLLMVSHDRTFLNNIVTSTLVFEENFNIKEYVGGYDDWLHSRKATTTSTKSNNKTNRDKPVSKNTEVKAKTKKLKFNETKELEALQKLIEKLELEIEIITQKLADPDFYKQESNLVNQNNQSLQTLQKQLENQYKRWEQLES